MKSIQDHTHFANLMIAFKQGDLNKYLKELEYCKRFLPDDIYVFYYNFSKATLFSKKGYFKK